MAREQNSLTAAEMAKAALAAIRGDRTIAELAVEYGVAPDTIEEWKARVLTGAAADFAPSAPRPPSTAALEKQACQLSSELEWLKAKVELVRGGEA